MAGRATCSLKIQVQLTKNVESRDSNQNELTTYPGAAVKQNSLRIMGIDSLPSQFQFL